MDMKTLGYDLILKKGGWAGHALCEVPTEYLTWVAFTVNLTPEELKLVDEELKFRSE